MDKLLKKCPIPIAGLILGLAVGGNLIQSYGNSYRNTLGIVSGLLLILLLAKIIKYPKNIKEDLNNPVIGSVFPTLSMATMILSTYIKPYAASMAYAIWIIGLVFHIVLILWFTNKFVFNFNIKKVFPSWFIVYVGIVAASVTAPVYNMISIGKIMFWFGFITYFILLAVISYRVLKIKELPEMTLPTLIIYSAPASLLLAGYMNSFQVKNMTIVWLLMILSIVMYCIALFLMPKLLMLKFYPSYSSFTFPFIISGIAIKLTNGFLVKKGQPIELLKYVVKFQEIIGICLVLYVLVRYLLFLTASAAPVQVQKAEAK